MKLYPSVLSVVLQSESAEFDAQSSESEEFDAQQFGFVGRSGDCDLSMAL